MEEAANIILWLHQLAGQVPISQHPIVKATLDGLQQQLAKSKKQKELEMLQKWPSL